MAQTIYFYGHKANSKYSYLSNFYPSEFMENKILYHCSEQYFMAQKADLMNDLDIYDKILQAETPFQCKKLGRKVKNWNQQLWNENKCEIMFAALYYKFAQNNKLAQKLLATGDSILVEASPYDRIWGIGLSIKDAELGKQWKGENLLGKSLMKVRDTLNKNS